MADETVIAWVLSDRGCEWRMLRCSIFAPIPVPDYERYLRPEPRSDDVEDAHRGADVEEPHESVHPEPVPDEPDAAESQLQSPRNEEAAL
jgi:hypothetical protein